MRTIKIISIFVFLLAADPHLYAQPDKPFSREATAEQRTKTYRNLVNKVILTNLSLPLDSVTEEKWIAALDAMLLLKYRSNWTDTRISTAFPVPQQCTDSFIIKLIEYIYNNRLTQYSPEVIKIFDRTDDPRLATACIRYLLSFVQTDKTILDLNYKVLLKFAKSPYWQAEMKELFLQRNDNPDPAPLLAPDYLPGHVFMLCLLNKNRQVPGICLVRDTAGNWMKDSMGKLIEIPILALSQTDMPGIMPNGNTPAGLFRMDGFGRSSAGFIGPSRNIQLTLPFEYKASHFYSDSSLADTSWSIEQYSRLLPASFRQHSPSFQAYRAGASGRREIIVHGSTVDPAWYRGATFSPHTPTLGCLMARETWDPETGRLIESDMEKLSDLVDRAGGPNGYLFVMDIRNDNKPVSFTELKESFMKAGAR